MTTISILLTSFTVSKHIMHLCKAFLVNHNAMIRGVRDAIFCSLCSAVYAILLVQLIVTSYTKNRKDIQWKKNKKIKISFYLIFNSYFVQCTGIRLVSFNIHIFV